ncbi:uncharacterized protein LOC106155093 isoform X1 [Lingula anatina]|uniref:Uncharacterized protein LOC106155093 isoform X1 n=1 Tax=Lingula anatina TaxID=7574 RepID=A0A1S3HGJ2_LINAN|nr:uncharacterized protein LOC106155093 isoform X1 [Lingula anatina]|eukprot:XP_013385203.1 uncharacterized protein LOC106155093 isoform X1 [Lingula anatina]
MALTDSLPLLLLVLGLGLIYIHICHSRPIFLADSHYSNNKVDSRTVTYTANKSCPPCAKGEYLLTDETAKNYPCLCSKCPEGMYLNIDDRCMKCDCCNKTNIITGENIWGHKIKECDAQFPDKKCDSDADYKATCNAEPTPGPPTPPFFVRFPWMYAVIVAAVVGIALSIVGLVQVYRRWKKSNEGISVPGPVPCT